MKDAQSLGSNKTGIDMSPIHTSRLLEETFSPLPPPGDSATTMLFRGDIIKTADVVGTVPLPGTLKGMATTIIHKLKGDRPEIFVDKLGERIAFERTGVRLYDLLINKCRMPMDEIKGLDIIALETIRDDELKHFHLACEVMSNIGGDPTSMTPAADVAGVMSMGLVQTLSDARTNVAQALQAILIVELADNDAWGTLIQLAQEQGMDDVVNEFRSAEAAEQRHLEEIRALVALTMLQEPESLH